MPITHIVVLSVGMAHIKLSLHKALSDISVGQGGEHTFI